MTNIVILPREFRQLATDYIGAPKDVSTYHVTMWNPRQIPACMRVARPPQHSFATVADDPSVLIGLEYETVEVVPRVWDHYRGFFFAVGWTPELGALVVWPFGPSLWWSCSRN